MLVRGIHMRYALLFNQVRLMEDSGSIATASRVERIVGNAETFQIALEVSKVLFDLSLCILSNAQGTAFHRALCQQYVASKPGHWELVQGYRKWLEWPSNRAR